MAKILLAQMAAGDGVLGEKEDSMKEIDLDNLTGSDLVDHATLAE